MSGEIQILRIDASARRERSLSRSLADAFLKAWSAERPSDEIIYRDVGIEPPPMVSEAWIGAAFTPAGERTAEQNAVLAPSDALIDELRRSDVVVISTPMYNYGMPAALKAWVDQVIRVNETFTFDLARGDWPLEPTLAGKTLVLLTSAGEFGYAPGGPRAHMNQLTPHFHTLRGYLGVEDLHEVGIEYQEFKDERHERSVASAFERVDALAKHLAADRSAASPV